MAETDRDLDTIQGESGARAEPQREMPPVMPHTSCSHGRLDIEYPKLEAPADEKLDDAQDDARDIMYQDDLKIANALHKASQRQGRRRRPEKEEELVEAAGGAASESQLCVHCSVGGGV